MRSIFDRHDFAFTWSYGEFDAACESASLGTQTDHRRLSRTWQSLLPQLSSRSWRTSADQSGRPTDHSPGLRQRSYSVSTGSIHNITVDPPYYDNVQYAELSDFFYVWLKRSVGHLFPEFFRDELTNKDDEAVANPARFASLGSKKGELAKSDYERKMAAAFREMHRVLRDDGCSP